MVLNILQLICSMLLNRPFHLRQHLVHLTTPHSRTLKLLPQTYKLHLLITVLFNLTQQLTLQLLLHRLSLLPHL